MIGRHHIHGHAIVSGDHKIATPEGTYPKALFNPADQKNFHEALDKASVTVLGRLGHETDKNPRLHNRLVVSSKAKGLERRPDGWWWNPAYVPAKDALDAVAPEGGVAAIVGGQRVFDLFLDAYDQFHLARAEKVTIPGGLAIFHEVEHGKSPEAVLAAHGLKPQPVRTLDAANRVTLTVFVRPRSIG
jgi:dihydrofolate reductase